MARKGFVRNIKPFEMLSREQVETIHRETLYVLDQVGIRIEHNRALKLFGENGCKVDYDKMRVRIPPGLAEECLREAPSIFSVKARDPRNDLIMGGNTLHFMAFPGMQIVDLDTWEPRVPTRKEYYDGVTILDALNNFSYLSCYTPYFGFEGVPEVMVIPECVAAKIRNSTKIQRVCYGKGCEVFNIEMVKTVGAEAMGMCLASPPLTYYGETIEATFRYVKAGFPIVISSGVIAGGTGPATIAGSTITNNAELIAAVVLIQLIEPKTRVVVGDFTFPQNMRTGSPAFGTVGSFLHQAVFNQIWRKYGIPIVNSAVGVSNSKEVDFQNGYERSIAALTAAISGANSIQLHGGIHGELTFHPVQAILDDDIAGIIGRFIRGVEVNDETLAVDLIEKVGPIPGFYLDKAHTRKWWRKEQFIPRVADRLTYPEWREKGKKNALDYAMERMEEILVEHKPIPLTENQEEEIEKILEEARKYYRKRGLM